MADPIEPIPSPPAAEPFDVPTTPAGPPTEPFDVPTYPYAAPAEPFDVPVFPFGPPADPFDVPTYPSPAPVGPFDVPTTPAGPPWGPIDVPVNPAGPPADPFDVSVTPSSPPAVPFDVLITPAAGPALPFDVSITPSAPPAPPSDVPVTMVEPPAQPFDVQITLSDPPAVPFDVPTFPSLPAVQIEGNPGESPTIDAIISAVSRFDQRLGSFLGLLVEVDPVTAGVPGGGALDPRALAKWFRDYELHVGPGGIGKFITEQSVLYAMNPVVARVFDPTYFIKMLIPGSMGNFRTALDLEAGVTMDVVARAEDAALTERVSLLGLKPTTDEFDGGSTYQEGQAFSVDSLVDAVLDNTSHPYLKVDGSRSPALARFDATAFFEDRRSDGSSQVRGTAKNRAASGIDNVMDSKLARSNAIDGIIRVGVPGEQIDGVVYSTSENPAEIVDDDDTRVPLVFTDLRKDVRRQGYRSVYFRPENLQFASSFSPEYSDGSSFGRVDPNVGYQRTTRTVNLSFEVHAMAPEDLRLMYNKMHWLTSMVYPSYGADSLLKSGPVARLRIGDVISSDIGGVGGVITSLNFDFADALWELKQGMKVPRMFKVAVDFKVLHDGPVGVLDGNFGVLQLPPGTPVNKDTNLAGSPMDSRGETPTGATYIPGKFSRFGEPRK